VEERFGAFCRKRGRFRNLNATDGDIGTAGRDGEREICAVFAGVFRTGALLRYHRRAIAPSLLAFRLISSPAKAETKTLPGRKTLRREDVARHPPRSSNVRYY
jgi:hypothetical protein